MKSKASIDAKILRLNLNSISTKRWDDMPQIKKQEILNKLDLYNHEKPVLLFYPNESYFWLLTEKRFVIYENNIMEYLALDHIEIPDFKDIFPDGIPFQELDKLEIIYHGKFWTISIEKGTWHIIYNLLIFLYK